MKPEEKYPGSLDSSTGSSDAGSARFLQRQKIAVALGIFLTVLGLYGAFSYRSAPTVIVETPDRNGEEANTRPINQNGRYYKSLFENDPGALQESFLADVKNGRIDALTRSDSYFILHRYVDNGGNIYEPYDFIESHPELHFLKEAESIYPESFDLIRSRKLPFSYTDQGMYAYLAYLETLEKNGYANITTLGTLVNQYAKMAYHKRQIINARAQGDPLPEYPKYTENGVARDREMAEKFQRSAQQAVEEAIERDSQGVDSQYIDVVFGAEQYASGLRYLAALHSDVVAEPASSEDIFAFITRYSYQRIPEFYFYVSLSNASTLLLLDSVTSIQLKNALYPFLDISDKDKRRKQYGMVEKVIRAREEPSVTRFRDLDLYSRKNIVELGRRVPEFKAWLISNGWKEQDFDE